MADFMTMARAGALALILGAAAGCGGGDDAVETPASDPAHAGEDEDAPGEAGGDDDDDENGEADAPAPVLGSLDWALNRPERSTEAWRRDEAMQPREMIAFFRITPEARVLHAWPDAYYAELIAPYVTVGGGSYLAAVPTPEAAPRCADGDHAHCRIETTALTAASPAPAPDGSVDVALAVRTVHAWMALDMAEKAFADIFAALAPGGYLAVVEARAAPGGTQDPGAPTGYVQESYVRMLAEEAGFVFVEDSALGENPADDADHPFGVWTLAPWRLTAPLGAPADPEFDRAPYDLIGEPDRMVLLFQRPVE